MRLGCRSGLLGAVEFASWAGAVSTRAHGRIWPEIADGVTSEKAAAWAGFSEG